MLRPNSPAVGAQQLGEEKIGLTRRGRQGHCAKVDAAKEVPADDNISLRSHRDRPDRLVVVVAVGTSPYKSAIASVEFDHENVRVHAPNQGCAPKVDANIEIADHEHIAVGVDIEGGWGRHPRWAGPPRTL